MAPKLPEPSAPGKSLLSASAEGAKFLILLQISSRLLTFIVNQLLLRYLSPALLGISVQLELFTISVLYFSRESLRNAVQRQPSAPHEVVVVVADNNEEKEKKNYGAQMKGKEKVGGGGDTQTVINLSLLAIPLGVFFSATLGWFYAGSLASVETAEQPYFRASVGLYVFATLLELVGEPGFAIAQQRMMYRLRAGAESAATGARCVLTCGVTVWAARRGIALGPLPFAVGQMGYGLVLLLVYGVQVWRMAEEEGFRMGLRRIEGGGDRYYKGYFSKPLSSLAVTMWIQSSIKHVLTQGDSILVAWWTTIHEQGVYALAANYGSLVARMLFQPLEESSRNLFAKLLSQKDKDGRPDSKALASAARILKIMIKLYLLLSFFATVLGPPFAPVGLKLVAGSRWGESAAGGVLATYCYYIPLLAINGITEAFVQSVATPKELHAQSVWMFSFSLGFGIAGYLFVRTLGLGAEGLVWANVVNMVLRITWSSVFIQRYFRKNGLKPGWAESLPSGTLAAVAVALGAVVRGYGTGGRLPRVAEMGLVHQLGFATVEGGVLLVACAVTERKFFLECWNVVRAGR